MFFSFFFIIVLSFFCHVSSFLLPVVPKFSKKCKIVIFLEFFHFFIMFYQFSSFLLPVVQKLSKKWKIAIFLEFFSFFFHFLIIFLSRFIIFASSGATIFKKMENCNFPRVAFHFFIIFLSWLYHFLSF